MVAFSFPGVLRPWVRQWCLRRCHKRSTAFLRRGSDEKTGGSSNLSHAACLLPTIPVHAERHCTTQDAPLHYALHYTTQQFSSYLYPYRRPTVHKQMLVQGRLNIDLMQSYCFSPTVHLSVDLLQTYYIHIERTASSGAPRLSGQAYCFAFYGYSLKYSRVD